MKTCYYSEDDDWTPDGPKITDPEKLEAVRHCLEKNGSIIVEHWIYRGSQAPDRLVFDDYEEFVEYLDSHACAGNVIDVWSFHDLCRIDNRLASGKCPNDAGLIPKRGAY